MHTFPISKFLFANTCFVSNRSLQKAKLRDYGFHWSYLPDRDSHRASEEPGPSYSPPCYRRGSRGDFGLNFRGRSDLWLALRIEEAGPEAALPSATTTTSLHQDASKEQHATENINLCNGEYFRLPEKCGRRRLLLHCCRTKIHHKNGFISRDLNLQFSSRPRSVAEGTTTISRWGHWNQPFFFFKDNTFLSFHTLYCDEVWGCL